MPKAPWRSPVLLINTLLMFIAHKGRYGIQTVRLQKGGWRLRARHQASKSLRSSEAGDEAAISPPKGLLRPLNDVRQFLGVGSSTWQINKRPCGFPWDFYEGVSFRGLLSETLLRLPCGDPRADHLKINRGCLQISMAHPSLHQWQRDIFHQGLNAKCVPQTVRPCHRPFDPGLGHRIANPPIAGHSRNRPHQL